MKTEREKAKKVRKFQISLERENKPDVTAKSWIAKLKLTR